MIKTEKLNFIEGTFLDEEAKEILLHVFLTKIQFHEKKNFSSQVRFGKDDETANKRIPELKNEMDKINQIVAEAKALNKKLVITSDITVSLSED